VSSVSEKRKTIAPKRPSRQVTIVEMKREEPSVEASLLARLAHAEEEVGHMLVRLTRAEERARNAEAAAGATSDDRVLALLAEQEALKEAMREAATVLLRALRPGGRRLPPPLPDTSTSTSTPSSTPTVDVTEIAEMVESLRPPPNRS
jgi:hypothetical protein